MALAAGPTQRHIAGRGDGPPQGDAAGAGRPSALVAPDALEVGSFSTRSAPLGLPPQPLARSLVLLQARCQ